MENILNHIKAKKKIIDAEKECAEAEGKVLKEKNNQMLKIMLEKLKPLEELTIQGESCTFIPSSYFPQITIEYGPAFKLTDYNITKIKHQIVLDYSVERVDTPFEIRHCNCYKRFTKLDEALEEIANILAPYAD